MDTEEGMHEPMDSNPVSHEGDVPLNPSIELVAGPVEPPPRIGPPEVANTVFEILVATMWSDGKLVDEEVERGRIAARALRARPRGGGAFAAIASGALPFNEIDFGLLTPDAARVAYAAAAWLVLANPTPNERRTGFLKAVGARMRIGEDDSAFLRRQVELIHGQDGISAELAFSQLLSILLTQPAVAS